MLGRIFWLAKRSVAGIRLGFLGWCFGLILGGATTIAGGQTPSLIAVPAEFRTNQILIQLKKNVSSNTLASFHAARHSTVLKTFGRNNRLQLLRVPKNETVPGLIAKYQQSGLVEFAEPDYIVHACAAPNDPYYTNGILWYFNNTGQDGGTPGADIGAAKAWDVLNSASNIVVAVLDTGIRYTHEDLAENMWQSSKDGALGFNAFTGKDDIDDDNGHGTLVAGVIGAVGNNGVGIVGVAWRVQLMACKCLDSSANGSDSTVIDCLEFATANGAQVINASFSSSGSSLAVSNALEDARAAGVIVVAACGNGNSLFPHLNVDTSPRYPACYPMDNIISVLYTTRTDDLGPLSYYGPTNVDLGAPGDQVTSTYTNSDSSYLVSTSVFGISGTSLAAPMVTGTCALMLAKYPSENYQQIIARILKATDPIPALAGKCVTGGRLNLWKALSPSINLVSVPGTNDVPFQLHLSTGPNRTCVIQSSTDLVNWTSIFTNTTDTNGVFDFTNDVLADPGQRFYRATAPP